MLLLASTAAGVFALVQRSDAQHKARIALGRQLGSEAVSEPRIDVSMLLAREALNLDRSLQTEGTLLATLLRDCSQQVSLQLIGEAEGGIRGLEEADRLRPDVVLLDRT